VSGSSILLERSSLDLWFSESYFLLDYRTARTDGKKLRAEQAFGRALKIQDLSGPEAIRVFESKRVDIVIMDYWMVGMNGITAAQKIKQLKLTFP
jgi:CheY-like chemotaxis protein